MSLYLSIMKVKMSKFISPFYEVCRKKYVLFFLLFMLPYAYGFGQTESNKQQHQRHKVYMSIKGQLGKMMYGGHQSPDYPGFGMSYAGEVSLGLQSNGSALWHTVFGYPDYGVSLWYSSLGNKDIYGFMHGITPEMTFNLHEKGPDRIRMRLGLGFAYFNKPHDFDNNRMNVIIGSHITNLSVATFYWAHQFTEKTTMNAGFQFAHCSNGHYTLPNLGLNMPLVFAGLTYRPKGNTGQPQIAEKDLPAPVQQGKWHISAGYGMHEFGRATTITAEKKYDVFSATFSYTRFFWKGGRYHIGITGKYYEDWYEKIRETDFYSKQQRLKSSAISLFLGHEFFFRHLSLYTQGGLNVYNPFFVKFTRLNYNNMNLHSYVKKIISGKLGLQYYLRNPYNHEGWNMYTGLYINSNFTQADFAELALGVVW